MTHSVAPLRQILLAYALLLSLLAAAWFVAGEPLANRLQQGQIRIDALALRVDALKQAADRDAALRPELAGEQMERLRRFIHGATLEAKTLEVGGSLLQRRVTEIIERHGGEPGNVRVDTDPETGTMTVSTRFSADLDGTADVLLELARARPLVFVELLSIRRRDHYLETAAGMDDGELVVQLDASSFWRPPAGDRSS